MRLCRRWPVWAAALLLAGCVAATGPRTDSEPPEAMQAVDPARMPSFSDDMALDGLAAGIQHSLDFYQRVPADKIYRFGPDRYDAAHMIRTCRRLLSFVRSRPNREALNRFLRLNFRIYRAVGKDGRGRVLFTGYFEPRLRGSLKRHNHYRYPVYARPADLIDVDLGRFSERMAGERTFGRLEGRRLVPYFSRREIDGLGRLAGRCAVLAWVQDPVALFFLQIQGSGRIFLDNGTTINVHYDASNGRPYRSIGKLLLDRGEIAAEEMSMQRIRRYLRDHPQELDPVLNHNESYVFFRQETGGPYGSLGVPVTPGRTIATDRRLFPPGAPAFIHTPVPEIDGAGRIHRWRSSRRLVLNQDTGGAIRGPGRADIFWGGGEYAELAAGHQRHAGALYFLVLKPGISVGSVRDSNGFPATAEEAAAGLTPTVKVSTSS